MNFAQFFVTRPIFAAVLSILIVIAGGLAYLGLPIAQYPEIVPPTVQVSATYPGADAATVALTVAAPIEQEVNGVENMLYMSSTSTNDGAMTLTITFKLGTNLDEAQVLVQNRVAIAEPKLPEEVRRLGVTTVKQSPDFMMVVNLVSPDGRYDNLYLSNYAVLQVKDVLSRVDGVGNVRVFGSGEYSVRVWLDSEQIAARNMTAGDVINAIREQNIQVAAGTIGKEPIPSGTAFQRPLTATGRLKDVDSFKEIIIKTGENGQVTKLADVATVELGAQSYAQGNRLDGMQSAGIGIFQLPGSNALETAKAIRATMDELSTRFPEGVEHKIVYDTTIFISESVSAVMHTLIEAFILVIIVVLVFLQNWRTTIIPLLAVPVSLIGTLGVMALFGFSLNNLSLFGLVLAIGIVVDDAIVVVENVERNMALGYPPLQATRRAMREVSGALIAIAVVLSAVFIPTAFISGITGQFYRQFALTVAVSTIISAFNSLTLSPALCALMLQPHHAPKDRFQRLIDTVFGWFFRGFEAVFAVVTRRYTAAVGKVVRHTVIAMMLYGGLLGLAWWGFQKVPSGFIPAQDNGYLIGIVQLPDGASLERTDEVVKQMADAARETPGVAHTIEIPGFSPLGGNASNGGAVFIILDEFHKRNKAGQKDVQVIGALSQRLGKITDGITLAFPPPPVRGLGSVGGFKMMIQDRGAAGLSELQHQTDQLIQKGNASEGLTSLFTTFRANTPQVHIDIDRPKLKQMGVSLTDIFQTLQIYMGSLYVNDITLFDRTYRVTAQAREEQRVELDQIKNFKIRNAEGQMVPLGTAVHFRETTGPDRVIRYNMYPAAEISGSAAPGYSSGQGIDLMKELAETYLPSSFGFEWTDLTYQQILAGNTAIFVFPLCVLFVFLTLAAQYESWSLPLAIILIVPMCLLSAIWGVAFRDFDNNIFTQIGLVVLVGLACKNAVLIVEFAKQLQVEGRDRFSAAVEASRLRLRPILMTSFAFILGVVPLATATGAGAEMRQALGTAVFFGMLGVTFFGIFFTPIFYVVIMKFGKLKDPSVDPVEERHGPEPALAAKEAESSLKV
ncbi:MAG TPA: multidrug efflux RND transporter permease subunit [Chthoniobacteraceae bacterium]|nr:multidrug efflux RND transporter permease subunit [Chthoniobacteraceae bacterium]